MDMYDTQDLYDVSKGTKYALIISNTFPNLKLESQRLCRHHVGVDPDDHTGMKRMESLLKSMSFQVECKQNVTKEVSTLFIL